MLLLVVVARLLYIVVAINYAPIHNYDFAFVDTAHSPPAFVFSVGASAPLVLLLLVIMLLLMLLLLFLMYMLLLLVLLVFL